MQDILSIVESSPRIARLREHLANRESVYVEGLWGSSAALLTTALADGLDRVALAVMPQMEQAEAFSDDVALFAPNLPMLFPAWETLADEDVPDTEVLAQRLAVMKFLAARRDGTGAAAGAKLIVAPIQALLQRVPSTALVERNTLTLRQGTVMPLEKALEWLLERGFRSERMAEAPGEFSRRGGILDLYPYAGGTPARVELDGDVVASIRSFDPGTQASANELPQLTITAVPRETEAQLDAPGNWSSLLDHLPKEAWLALKEPAEIMQHGLAFSQESPGGLLPDGLTLFNTAHTRFPRLHMAALPGVFSGRPVTFHVHSVERFSHDMDEMVHELELSATERKRTVVLCGNSGEKERLTEMLADSKLPVAESFEIRIGQLTAGFDWTELSLTLLTHHELFHRYRERRAAPHYRHTRAIDSFYDLQPGDYVVHVTHGIGMFHNMELIERDGVREECLKIEYADKAFLYVPATRIELVQKYVGPAEHRPPLNKLGTQSWLLRKQRTEEAVHDLAAELLRIQALRAATQGIAHPPDAEWQREFEDAFPYEETEDQLRVADEVKRDLERARPMDRLICGDVGYGKTEIAMRAAVKTVFGGAQAAVLVPTTVLAAQHLRTFQERMADYPIRVEMLSRFLTGTEQDEVLAGLADGEVDIVIGTHRLIQSDVKFQNLGLVVIDEEQRFGVEHKERLKQLRATVDVLTLTATPIPRTLHMSILGLRDISSLDTPPRDRLAIHTRLMRFDPHKIRQAILHEMARDGQAFFLHNRVETIERVAKNLRELVPEARFLVGHGQMKERELADVMSDFVEHKADVLVCTTIIESGLDIPNANTILIDQADMFGLAELHQLRGRVGRYKHRAYAYMLLPADRPLTPVGEKRLKAIEEFSELGAGFRIAMRDLEIRGAGNILGPEQSGHIAAVGYDMYCRILATAVRKLKNEPAEERPEVSLSLGVEARLPEEYLPDPTQRIEMYRKLYRAQNVEDIESLHRELRDRYGPLPEPAQQLLTETRLRQLVLQAGIVSLQLCDNLLVATSPAPERALKALSATGMICRQIDDTTINVRLARTRKGGGHLLSFLVQALEKAYANMAARGMEVK